MGEAAARALMEPVSVTIQGKVIKMPKYQALAHKMVANLINANPADMSRLFRMLEKANAFDELKHQEAMQADEQNGNVWTAELEAQFQVLEAEFACQPDDVGTMPSGNVPSGNGDGDLAPGSFQAR
ncbi:hypothetical protein SAMN04488241_10916 [Sphingomonas rubra]|uniref:Uncharacterized protein n=2 Tax=Sphingomonas rubra TaxID=634430 RepID=A0A1I5TSB5_9SPHN|nr:hypothetical protein SAMN04488241_10916 [Sphingomonas rubra]